jgi:hypothetical protein
MSTGLLEILEVYFEAFAETHAPRRAELLARCIADKGEIWGPNRAHHDGRSILGRDIAAGPGIMAAPPRRAATAK